MSDFLERQEKALSTSISAHSEQRLPQKWLDFSRAHKMIIVSRLRRQMHLRETYKEPLNERDFDTMHYSDRWAVINHLIKSLVLKPMKPLSEVQAAKLRVYSGAPGGGKSHLLAAVDFGATEARILAHLTETNDIYKDLPFMHSHQVDAIRYAAMGPFHGAPNGGKRILKSLYTQLKSYWVRASGHKQEIHEMNKGHLENTIKLLQESHCNLLGRSTFLLGKMHMHFQNQPAIQAKLEELCHLMSAVEVDDLYPVFKTLAKEAALRKSPPVVDFTADMFVDDDLNVVD